MRKLPVKEPNGKVTNTAQKNLSLLFITKPFDQYKNGFTQVELASVVCLAESQRKRASLLREKPEKITCISKMHYPIWAIKTGNFSVLVDGLNNTEHVFRFNEPTKTMTIIEELKKNSANLQQFLETLELQKETVANINSPTNMNFPGLITDKELITFFQEYFESGTLKETENPATLPVELNSDDASQTFNNLSNCLRTMKADAKALQNALNVLEEEMKALKNAAGNEIEYLQEKCAAETNALRPSVDKKTKRISQKADKVISVLQKKADKKIASLEKQREKLMHRLQIAEQRKDNAAAKREAVKKRTNRSSAGSFAIKRYEQEISNIKKQISEVTKQLEKFRGEISGEIKQKEEEFRIAISQEEAKITEIQTNCQEKVNTRQSQIGNLNTRASEIIGTLENQINELNSLSAELKSNTEVNWSVGASEDPVLVQLPVYFVKYAKGSQDERYMIVTPIAFSQEVGVLNGLKKMFSLNPEPRLTSLAHPASKKLQETLSAQVLEKIQKDADFKIKLNSVCRTSNLIDQNSFAQNLNEGLDEIEKLGFMTSDEASDLCKRMMEEMA